MIFGKVKKRTESYATLGSERDSEWSEVCLTKHRQLAWIQSEILILQAAVFSKITSQIKISYKDHRKFTKRSSRLIVTLLEGWFSTLTLSKNSDLASGASSIPLLSWEYFSLAISILLWWCEYCSFASILVFFWWWNLLRVRSWNSHVTRTLLLL